MAPIQDVAGNDAPDFTASATVLSGYTLELCDWKTNTLLADLTGAATFTIKPRRSGQPLAILASLAADNADIRTIWGDGDRKLVKGTRSLKVRKNGALVGHGIVWHLEYSGDENTTTVQITAYDPLYALKGRPYRDGTGNLIDPDIASPISGAQILKDGVANSISNSGGAGDQEGSLPLDATTGSFDTSVPPAADLGIELADWPINLDDVVTLLADTGAVDIWVTPVEASGVVGRLNVTNRRGSDLSGSVHFDYATGLDNAKACSRVDDMDDLQNKLQYYLGPKKATPLDPTGASHWSGNITGTELTPVDLSAYETLQLGSRAKYWTIMRIRTFDDDGTNASARPLFHTLWKEEVRGSVNGQEILHITPAADSPFEPFDDYNPGDTVGVNVGDICGPALSGATQRIDGFDVAVDVDGLGQVSELQTLQDS